MGATCAKILPVNHSNTSKTHFKNQVNPLPPSDNLTDENQIRSEENLDDENKILITKKENDFRSQDDLSKGDHVRDEESDICKNIVPVEQNITSHQDLSNGDYRREHSEINDNYLTQVGHNLVLQDAFPEKVNDTEYNSTVNNWSITQIEQKISPDELSSGDHEGLNNSNANSKTDEEENPYRDVLSDKENNQEEVLDGKGNKESNPNVLSETEPKEDSNTSTNSDDALGHEGKKDDSQLKFEPVSILRDSLYFFPLDDETQQPQTPQRLQERLQNTSHKPALTYDERMLLADLNRFQQLDKRREFAVRRNQSVSRNGKLPKITGVREVSPENSSENLNNSDN